jgi:hypothetical protein
VRERTLLSSRPGKMVSSNNLPQRPTSADLITRNHHFPVPGRICMTAWSAWLHDLHRVQCWLLLALVRFCVERCVFL